MHFRNKILPSSTIDNQLPTFSQNSSPEKPFQEGTFNFKPKGLQQSKFFCTELKSNKIPIIKNK
jgi:hypothetical protein